MVWDILLSKHFQRESIKAALQRKSNQRILEMMLTAISHTESHYYAKCHWVIECNVIWARCPKRIEVSGICSIA